MLAYDVVSQTRTCDDVSNAKDKPMTNPPIVISPISDNLVVTGFAERVVV